MLLSMTGYGQAKTRNAKQKRTVIADLKSINSRGLDLITRMPKSYQDKEFEIRNILSQILERGKITLTLQIEAKDDTSRKMKINKALLKSYLDELVPMAKKMKLDMEDCLPALLNLPDVLESGNMTVNEEEWKQVQKTIEQAAKKLNESRAKEGKTLEKDFHLRIKNISYLLAKVESMETDRIPVMREKLEQLLKNYAEKTEIDKNRLEQELIYYAEKMDFTEEKVRLKSHCDYFLKTLDEKESGGKRLSFITQEMGREINTLGSKANHAEIQKYIVMMKEELEKIKEQVLNVL